MSPDSFDLNSAIDAAAPARADDEGFVIRLEAGKQFEIVGQVEAALLCASPTPLFQRGGLLVRPGWCPAAVPTSDDRNMGLRLISVGPIALTDILNGLMRFEKFDGRSEAWMPCNAPRAVAEIYASRVGHWRLPTLTGLIESPTMRADGSILDQPGYDAATGLLFQPSADFPPIPREPSRDDAMAALNELLDLIASFPFIEDPAAPDHSPDRSVALSAFLTALVRRTLPTAPLHGFTAPVAGSGKSLLVDMASILATGRPSAVLSQGQTAEEFEKRLAATLIAGDLLVSIDNCELPLGSDLLCQALTQQVVRLRPLGGSMVVDVPTNAMLLATGNNLALSGDMTRRALLCRLDPQCERPELRQFDRNPLADAMARRGELVRAGLTVLRAYAVAGRPGRLPPLGSFEAWSDTVRSALVWSAQPDPCATMEEARAADPVLDSLTAVLSAWWGAIGGDKVTTGELIRRATASSAALFGNGVEYRYPEFREALLVVAGDSGAINSRRLGKWLTRHQGRIVNGLCLNREGITNGSPTWKLYQI